MQRPARRMTPDLMVHATLDAKYRVRRTLELARALEGDTRQAERLALNVCKACFYREPRIAGAAITQQPCMCCGEVQMYGSTNTDALCFECAHTHSLCKHCGGDLDMDEDRASWPAPQAK